MEYAAFARTLLGLALTVIVLLALVPADAVSANAGFWASCVAAGLGFVVVRKIAARRAKPIVRYVLPCAVVAAAKLVWGVYVWDAHYYALDGQTVRPDLEFSEIFHERAADTAVVDELLRLFANEGVRYYGPSAADLSINNRPPAHVVAIVARAFGGQYAAYFPFVAWMVGLASLSVIAALLASGVTGPVLKAAAAMAIMWPMGWGVASVMKDTLLVAIVGLCGAWMSILSVQRRTVLPAAVAAAILVPPFRPAYAIVCGLVLALVAFRRRDAPAMKVLAAVAIVVAWAALMPLLEFSSKLESYRPIDQAPSPVFSVPVLGRIAFALGTPFPWSQMFDAWWKHSYVWLFAAQVLTGAMIVSLVRSGKRLFHGIDYGALLGAGLVIGGIVSPTIQPGYVHAGTIAVFPYAMARAGSQWSRSVMVSAGVYFAANAAWMLLR